MLNKDAENKIKVNINKTLINDWICFLADVWGNDLDVIKRKLIFNIQDKFIWDKSTEQYVNSMLDKLSNYDNRRISYENN